MAIQINKQRLFVASCFALLTTAFTFGIRAGIMGDLTSDMGLSNTQLGWINFMGVFGFPIATLIGGPLYNSIGPKKLGWTAFFSHILGITFSILSQSFWPLFASTFFLSFGNGMVEAAYNPMISEMYTENKAKMLNKFHVWFPGGVAIGALLAFLSATYLGFGWQAKIAIMFVPTVIYGFLFFGQEFPKSKVEGGASSAKEFKAILSSPIYWLMLVCMALTATTELGTQSWVEKLLQNTGAQPLLALVLITGLMAVGRYFAGPVIKKLDITGVLLGSALISVLSIYMLSVATGGMVYVAAIMFAIGVCYFWPNMISFVATYLPKTGALGMSLIGGVGMLGLSIFQPIIGRWMDTETARAEASGLVGDAANLAAGQATLDNIAVLPAILVVAFAGIYINRHKIKAKNAS